MKQTRKITYSAVLLAISIVFMLLAAYTPASIVPLIVTSLCYYIAYVKCGLPYGIITAVLALLVCFFACGGFFSSAFLFSLIVFFPYSLLAYLYKRLKLNYNVFWQAVVRILCSAAFFAGVFIATVFLTDYILDTTIVALVNRLGRVLAVVLMALITLPLDFFFDYLSNRIIKMLK